MRKRISWIVMLVAIMTVLVGFDKEEKVKKDANLTFAQLENLEFILSSGAGAWRNTLYIAKDGTFVGVNYDSNAGDAGYDYPNGTTYYCDFYGSFTEPKKVNDYTYSMTMKEIHNIHEPDTSEIRHETKYIYGESGWEETKEILIYLPGAPISELPEEFLLWTMYNQDGGTELSFCGLYDVNQRMGLFSNTVSKELKTDLSALNMQSDWIEKMLKHDNLTLDIKEKKAKQLFDLWTNAMNTAWNDIDENIQGMLYEELVYEQSIWSGNHEDVLRYISEESEGASEQNVMGYQEAAKAVKERVYQLYLKLHNEFL